MRKRAVRKKPEESPAEEAGEGGMMSLSSHLRELRNRLLVCVVFFVVTAVVGLNFAPRIVEALLHIGEINDYTFVYIAPQELMLQYFFVAIVLGICAALPVILYEVWAFVRPALVRRENALFLCTMIFGLVCFCAGVVFAYAVMLRFMLRFFVSLNEGSVIEPYISVQSYISFLVSVMLVFGIVFELPVVSVILNRLGILKVKWMRTARRVVVVVIFVVAAVITPPDVISQVMVALPMLALYELSIVLCALLEKIGRRRAKEAAGGAAE